MQNSSLKQQRKAATDEFLETAHPSWHIHNLTQLFAEYVSLRQRHTGTVPTDQIDTFQATIDLMNGLKGKEGYHA